MLKPIHAVSLAAVLLAGAVSPALAQGEVNVYSYRETKLIQPLFDAFTKDTGIKVNVISASSGLEQRIKSEGENSPADVLLTVDIGRLEEAVKAGISQPIVSAELDKVVPAQFRDPEGHWYAISMRARVVYASKERVQQTSLTYEELADPKWKGKICTRSGQHVYTIGLVASMIANKGAEETEKWLVGLRDNLARKPAGNDRSQVQGIMNGECDLALGNTYYMGAMMNNEKEPEQKEWAASAKILFPNAADRGAHVNISGVVMAKHAPNKDNAVKLIEFLTTGQAQKIYAEANFEYPVTPGVEPSDLVKSWGELKADSLPLSEVAKFRKEASELVDKVAFDEGPKS